MRSSICICARDSIWNTPTVSASWISAYTAASSSERATGRRSRRAFERSMSMHSSTADSMPRPSRSILRKPASEQESLSHWQSWRPAMAAGTSGTRSAERLGRDDHAPRVLREVARQAGDLARQRRQHAPAPLPGPLAQAVDPLQIVSHDGRVPAVGRARQAVEVGCRQPERPCRARGSRRAHGRSETPRSAALRSYPKRSCTARISRSRMSRGKSRSMSGMAASSRFRKRPSERRASTGSTCDNPVR